MTIGLLVVGVVGDNPQRHFNALRLDSPSLKDWGDLGMIIPRNDMVNQPTPIVKSCLIDMTDNLLIDRRDLST